MEFANTKVLVTGGTGFLGHHIVNALLEQKADVTLLVQPHEKTWRLENIKSNVNIEKVALIDREETKLAVKKICPNVIIHLAGIMERRRDLSIMDNLIDQHISSTINLILAADPDITKLIINTGTSEEYGEQNDPFSESLPVDPVSPYSATKAAVTAIVTYISRSIKIPIITMRPFITYGPGQLHDTLIPFLIKGVLLKKKVELTSGLQYRDFIYVDDLVSCYLAVIQKAELFKKPTIFNVGTGKKISVRNVIEEISSILDGKDYLKLGARPMRPGEPPSMIADISKAKKIIDWEPLVSIKDGLKKTIEWWLDHEELWKDKH